MASRIIGILGILLIFSSQLVSQCECTDCTFEIPEDGTDSSVITISGATNATLGSNGQQVCQVCLTFLHDAIEEVTIELFAPDGSSVILSEESGTAFDDNIFWGICFLSCDQTASPDPGFSSEFDSSDPWQFAGVYTGTYYPFDGCLEDLTGDVNGDWEIVFTDNEPGDGGDLFDWYLVFADDSGANCANSGTCGNGPSCQAEGGELISPDITACESDNSLVIDVDPTYPNGNEPPAVDYDYSYIIYDANTEVILDINPDTDLTSYAPGEYVICGLSYLITDEGSIPDPDGSLELGDIQDDIDDEVYCADISDVCISVSIEEPVEAPDFVGPLDVCPGELVVYEILNYDPNINYIVNIQSGSFDFFSGTDGVFEVIWNSGPGIICALIESVCGNEETCLNVNVQNQAPELEIIGNLNPCPGDIESYSFIPSPGAGESYTVNVTNGTLISQSVDGAEIEWLNSPATGEICIELIGAPCPVDIVCEAIEIELDYELPNDFDLADELCFGSTETASIASDPAILDYIWTATNINIIGGLNTDEIEFEGINIGLGTVCLEVLSDCGVQGPICQDIEILEQPSPVIDPVVPQCAYTFVLNADVLGSSELEWNQLNGPSDADIDPTDDVPADVEVFESGIYSFELIETNGVCEASNEIIVEILPDLELSEVEFVCDLDENYSITFEILSGMEPYTINGELISGNTFTSDLFESGEEYIFSVVDDLGCQTEIEGEFECPCFSDAGTMQQDVLTACAEFGAFVQADWNEDGSLDGNDIGTYVLHDEDGEELGQIIAISEDGIFFYDDDIIAGQSYYISYIVGDELNNEVDLSDDCLSVAEGQEVIFYPFPEPTYTIENLNCDVIYSVIFDYDNDETGLEFSQIDGPADSDIEFIDDEELEITFELNGTYTFEAVYDLEGCITTELIDIEFNSAPMIFNVSEDCDNSGDSYRVTFEISGGTAPYDVSIDGELNGNSFTSVEIPTGEIYTIQVSDVNGCVSTELTGQKLCDCISDAGVMAMDLIEACGPLDSIRVDSAFNFILDADDVAVFYLHRGTSFVLESVIDSSLTGSFYYNSNIQLDTIYYVSFVVGDSIMNYPDLEDPCLGVAIGQAVVWRSLPDPIAGPDIVSCASEIAMTASPVEGRWEILLSPDINALEIEDSTDPNTFIRMNEAGEYLLSWTVSNGTCTNSDTLQLIKREEPELDIPLTECSDDLSTYSIQIPFADPNMELTNNGISYSGFFEAEDLQPDSIYQFEFIDSFGCSTLIEVGPVNCDCSNDIGSFQQEDFMLCEFEALEIDLSNGDFTLGEGDTLAYILHDGTANMIGNILNISYGEAIDFMNSWEFNTVYYLTPVLTGYDPITGTLGLNGPCFIQATSSSVTWTPSYTFELNIDTFICQGDIVEIVPMYSGSYPFSLEIQEQSTGEVRAFVLDDPNASILLDGEVSSNWILTNTSGDCILSFSGEIGIEVKVIADPIFVDTSVCNNADFGSTLSLGDLFEGDLPQGSYFSEALVEQEELLEFDGFDAGSYELIYETQGSNAPCPEASYSFFIEVLECNCPEFDFSQIGFCISENEIDLSQFDLMGLAGMWQLQDLNGNEQDVILQGQTMEIVDIEAGAFTLLFEINDPDHPQVCDPIVQIPVLIEEGLQSGISSGISTFCEGRDETLILDELLEGADLGGEWYLDNTVVTNEVDLASLSPGIFDFEYRHPAGIYCSGSNTELSIEIIEEPFFEFISSDVLCFGDSIGSIELILSGAEQDYVCYLNDIIIEEGKQLEGLSPGIYEIFIQDENGCVSETQFITIGEPAPISVSLGADQQLSFQDPFTVEAIINILFSDLSEITWSDLNGLLGVEDLSYSSIATQDNTILVEIEDLNGCVAIDEIEIRVEDELEEIYIPNVFTPLSQDNDSRFIIQNTSSIELINSASIYDRWGNLVSIIENIEPDDPFEIWDGQFGAGPAEQGVYVYLIRLVYRNGESGILAGDVTLIR